MKKLSETLQATLLNYNGGDIVLNRIQKTMNDISFKVHEPKNLFIIGMHIERVQQHLTRVRNLAIVPSTIMDIQGEILELEELKFSILEAITNV